MLYNFKKIRNSQKRKSKRRSKNQPFLRNALFWDN
ncbi:hypothetical protein predicted by Glimmer/Critica [Helicobacter pylori B8]|uniref:Uncharacterized protein n=1 Tax=Helicobacter pylori (strain B8) TaxID=693745 RepID=D7FCJ7_HELP3|nr:hypothetical protein predicted by Glimmer/Critica [Helicobacter pylori B8]